LAFADPDDPAGAGSGEVVSAAGQCGRDPQQHARGISDDLHVHVMAVVLLGKVGPTLADPVALRECSVEQDVLGVGLTQDPQQAWRAAGQVVHDGGDIGVGAVPTDMSNPAVICASVSCWRR
jgi:hypothetical protein